MDGMPVFRANKRRKFVRHREFEPNLESESKPDGLDQQQNGSETDDATDENINISELVRLRKQNRPKTTGVKFSQQRRLDGDDETPDNMALAKINLDEDNLGDMANRFVGPTGQVVDIDKHMMAYVDSEMSKRHNVVMTTTTAPDPPRPTRNTDQKVSDTQQRSAQTTQPLSTTTYPSRIQLSEFDLGPDAHQRNQARTEAAIARAQSGLPPIPTAEEEADANRAKPPRRPRKPRLGRDGKPMRPRPPRKRRNSEDVARDALVESLLHEHRIDKVYKDGENDDDDDSNNNSSGADDNTGLADQDSTNTNADERLERRFKREFFDAQAERRQKNRVKQAAAAKAKGMGPEQTGPKLGGGRSARAKMAQAYAAARREQQQQQQGGSSSGTAAVVAGGGSVGVAKK